MVNTADEVDVGLMCFSVGLGLAVNIVEKKMVVEGGVEGGVWREVWREVGGSAVLLVR